MHSNLPNHIAQLKQRPRLGQTPPSFDNILNEINKLGSGVADMVRENAFSKLQEMVEGVTDKVTILAQRNEVLQRSLNLNVRAAAELGGILDNTAVQLGINSAKLRTYSTELDKVVKGYSKVIGEGKGSNKVLLEQYNRYRDVLGLTEEQSIALTKYSVVQGKASGDIGKFNDELASVAASISKNTGRTGVYADILQQIADAGPEISIAYGKSAEVIGKAAAKASRLGVSFKDLVGISNKFLDIESSISSELELQLLGGKKINSEKFRQAAVSQDLNAMSDALTEIIEDQGKGVIDNIFQRQALAKQLGIEEDKLLDIYSNLQMNAEMSGKTTDEYNSAVDAADKLSRSTTAEEQADAESVLTIQAEQRNKANLAYTEAINKAVGDQVKHIEDIQQLTTNIQSTTLQMSNELIKLIDEKIGTKNIATLLGFGTLAAAGGDVYDIVTGTANLNADNVYIEGNIGGNAPKTANDLYISPNQGTIVAGAFGAFQLPPQDAIMASPNIAAPNTNTNTSAVSSMPNLQVIIEGVGLDDLIRKIEMRDADKMNSSSR
jgi:hypothetical protein